MTRLNSITHSIPLTPQTDPNKFPRGDYKPYPRMMVQQNGKPFTDSSGRNPVIVNNEDEEEAFRAEHPGEVRDNVANAADMQDELVKLRAENAQLKADRGACNAVEKPPGGVSSLVKPGVGDLGSASDAVDKLDIAATRPAAQAAARRTPGKKLD